VPEKEVINGWLIGLGLTVVASTMAGIRWIFGVDGRLKSLESANEDSCESWREFKQGYQKHLDKHDESTIMIREDIATISANVQSDRTTLRRILDILESRKND